MSKKAQQPKHPICWKEIKSSLTHRKNMWNYTKLYHFSRFEFFNLDLKGSFSLSIPLKIRLLIVKDSYYRLSSCLNEELKGNLKENFLARGGYSSLKFYILYISTHIWLHLNFNISAQKHSYWKLFDLQLSYLSGKGISLILWFCFLSN